MCGRNKVELTIGGVGENGRRMASLGLVMVFHHRLVLLLLHVHVRCGARHVYIRAEPVLIGGRIGLVVDPLVGGVRVAVRLLLELLLLLVMADLDNRCAGVRWKIHSGNICVR